MQMHKINILANTLHVLFLSYGIKDNQLIKLQLKVFLSNEFNIKKYELLELLDLSINDLINEYDAFNDFNKDWFIKQSKNIIRIFGGQNE